MIRTKSFDATGIAPNGRLFAGDLNAIQDAAAALADLTQNVQVGSLTVGEVGLQIVRFGTGEGRITGAFRVDGILRGLSGLYAGQYTTTQRDAIAAGSRPTGLVIFNTTTGKLEINSGTDATPSWTALGAQITAASGTPPGASAANANTFYFRTDLNGGTLFYSTGTVWTKIAPGLTEAPPDGSVTTAKLASDVATVPIGGVIDWPWVGTSAPAWAVLPSGQAISRTTFAALFAIASATGLSTYGAGDGSTTFNVADYRGRVGVGKDDMNGTNAARITVAISGVAGTTLGAVFGAEGVTLTTAQLPAHNHTVTGTPGMTDPGHTHALAEGTQPDVAGGLSFNLLTPNLSGRSTALAFTGITLSVGSLATANAGSGSVHQNTQPSIIVNKLMRVQ